MKKGGMREKIQTSIREIVFGMEDALVSTLGAITGIAAGTGSTFKCKRISYMWLTIRSLSVDTEQKEATQLNSTLLL